MNQQMLQSYQLLHTLKEANLCINEANCTKPVVCNPNFTLRSFGETLKYKMSRAFPQRF